MIKKTMLEKNVAERCKAQKTSGVLKAQKHLSISYKHSCASCCEIEDHAPYE